MIWSNLIYKPHQIPKLECYWSRLVVAIVRSLEAKSSVEIKMLLKQRRQTMFQLYLSGPTILLLISVWLILEDWRQQSSLVYWCRCGNLLTHNVAKPCGTNDQAQHCHAKITSSHSSLYAAWLQPHVYLVYIPNIIFCRVVTGFVTGCLCGVLDIQTSPDISFNIK